MENRRFSLAIPPSRKFTQRRWPSNLRRALAPQMPHAAFNPSLKRCENASPTFERRERQNENSRIELRRDPAGMVGHCLARHSWRPCVRLHRGVCHGYSRVCFGSAALRAAMGCHRRYPGGPVRQHLGHARRDKQAWFATDQIGTVALLAIFSGIMRMSLSGRIERRTYIF